MLMNYGTRNKSIRCCVAATASTPSLEEVRDILAVYSVVVIIICGRKAVGPLYQRRFRALPQGAATASPLTDKRMLHSWRPAEHKHMERSDSTVACTRRSSSSNCRANTSPAAMFALSLRRG